jgi:hypothetical protein
VKGEDRAMTDPAPAGDLNRENQPVTSDDFACEQCGARLGRGHRFCSQRCWQQWRHENPPRLDREAPTHEEIMDEMREAYARAKKEVGS